MKNIDKDYISFNSYTYNDLFDLWSKQDNMQDHAKKLKERYIVDEI